MLNTLQKVKKNEVFKFTFKNLEQHYLAAIEEGYNIIPCKI